MKLDNPLETENKLIALRRLQHFARLRMALWFVAKTSRKFEWLCCQVHLCLLVVRDCVIYAEPLNWDYNHN